MQQGVPEQHASMERQHSNHDRRRPYAISTDGTYRLVHNMECGLISCVEEMMDSI